MAILLMNCPHCAARNCAVKIFAAQHWPPETWEEANYGGSHFYISAAGSCPACHEPIAVKLLNEEPTNGAGNLVETMMQSPHTVQMLGLRPLEIWPALPQPRIPPYLPPATETALAQAERAFSRRDYDAAAVMYRRALETALRATFPSVTGTLYARISALVTDRMLPSAIGEWAHEVRIIGNEAAHEDESPTLEDIKAMRDFVDAALRYAISLPKEIERRRSGSGESGEPRAV